MRIGIGIGDVGGKPATIDDLIEQTQAAERDGFASAWFANIFGFDAILTATVCARATSRIEVGTAIVPTYPRHPTAMAQQAMSAAAASGGRFTLGIGLSHQLVIEGMFGLSFAKPYSHMREYLAVLLPLLREGKVAYEGNEFRVNATLDVPGAKPPSVLIAALAPKMLALAGTVTDGTVTWMTGPKTLREHVVPRINEAAAQAGRPAPRVVAGLPIAVSDDVAAARETAGRIFQVYGVLPSYRAMLDREGVENPGDVALVGDESAVGEQIARLAEAGVTDLLASIFPVGKDPAASIARTRALLVETLRRV